MKTLKVTEIEFDDEQGMPVFVLKDGTKRYPRQVPTGSCWATYWAPDKPKQKDKENKQ